MASSAVRSADDIIMLSFPFVLTTVTVQMAKKIRTAGWVLIAFGILAIVLGIASIAFGSTDTDSNLYTLRISIAFSTAILTIIGGSVAVHSVNRGLKALAMSKRNGPNPQGFPGTFPS
ncbi:unnamed protein product [Darwinula stevensoni]|uniref:Uncharacterized protein n=1 Tax=Darwinula stevensoni TaxID=69355 RepID=A0A7R9A720_9CRUS|nr:unnamed protein product [Darwinula stevensoni]CAG0891135.1 unnamed protein product [Darwinula stevensoni]